MADITAGERFKWIYAEKSWGQTAETKFGGMDIFVNDCDGDFSEWFILINGEQVSSGRDGGVEPYHFHKCIADAESAALSRAESQS